MRLPPAVERYRRRGCTGPWRLAGETRRDFIGAVVIPALAEESSLFFTLRSLAANPPALLEKFLTVLVINHPLGAATEIQKENERTLQLLQHERLASDLPLSWIDAASPGLELPGKGGVGVARKIGFDLSLDRLHWAGEPPLLVSLDADTLVRPTYLPAILSHFRRTRPGGAVLPFCHQRGESPEQEEAIGLYELFLRSYALGLARAGSPYGFHTIGSAMACRAEAYVRCGGMNRRTAGEDFYFLQQLVKTVGVAQLSGTVVHPSSRISRRAPFGTGNSMFRLLAGNETILFHPVVCYRLLGDWLSLATSAWQQSATAVGAAARSLHPCLGDYLETIDFTTIWPRLQRQNRTAEAFAAAFHGWFDGLKTRKFLHRLASGPFPSQPAAESLPPLLAWAGLPAAGDLSFQLALLRGCSAAHAEGTAEDCGLPKRMQYCMNCS